MKKINREFNREFGKGFGKEFYESSIKNLKKEMSIMIFILIFGTSTLLIFLEGKGMFSEGLFQTRIDLIPLLITYVALRGNIYSTLTLTSWGGILFDTLSSNPLGTSLISFSLVGILISELRNLILRNAPFAQMTIGAITTMLNPLLNLGLLWGLGLNPKIGWGMFFQIGMMGIFGGIFCPFFFKIFDWLESELNFAPLSQFRSEVQIKRGRD